MKPGATKDQVRHVIALVREYGLKEHPIYGTDRTVIACIGDKRMVDKAAVENAPMVERVVPILAPYKMASLEVRQTRTSVEIGPERFPLGGPRVGVIAGPCSVENREILLRTAEAVRKAGCIGLRGGAFKPRTSPYSFQGMGEDGLRLLAEARDRTGLAVVTEVVGLEQLPACAELADVLQIGARNMQHYPLLEAVGQTNKPVLLKRGMSAQLDELLLAAEYIQPARDPVRARHPHFRDEHPLHAGHRLHRRHQEGFAPASNRRSQPRGRALRPGADLGAGRGRRGRRWDPRRSAPGSRECPLGRPAEPDFQRL